jgi:preprotein translocase subunit SecF
MFRLLHGTHYDFIKSWKIAVWLTVAFIVAGIAAIAIRGPKYSIEFTGGTLMQIAFKQAPNPADVRAALDAGGIHGAEIQTFGTNSEYTVRAQDRAHVATQAAGAESISRSVEAALAQRFGRQAFTVVRTEAVGPRVGSELRRGALYAVLASFLTTLLYLGFRFDWRFGVAAVIATAHDTLATIAFLALMNIEISLTVIAAILTVIGYSLNDTIIIFDRVRENLHKKKKESLYDTLNRSVNETLPRSVLTHATTLAATLALLFFAGEVIRPFAWIMSFGIFTGTFSSIYIAGPVLLFIEARWPRAADDRGRATSQRPPVAPTKAKSAPPANVAANTPARTR